jgi:TetR/AcrR family transcriptional regulator, cholesterol catabolism regulator
MKRKRKPLSLKRMEKLASIGKVACNLFTRNGYFETSLEDIAADAKISKGALYHYFPSKTALLYFILKRFGDRLLEDLEEELARIEDGFSKIRFIVYRHIDLSVQYRDEAKALINAKYSLPRKYFKVVTGQEKKYYEIVTRVLSDLLGDRINQGELTALTFSMFGMCNWIYTWYNPKGSVSPEQLSEIIFGTFTKGVGRYLSVNKDEGRPAAEYSGASVALSKRTGQKRKPKGHNR